MASSVLPPTDVKGMTEWNPELFNKTASVPCLRVKSQYVGVAMKTLKKYGFKAKNMKNVLETSNSEEKHILLNPRLIQTFDDIPHEDQRTLEQLDVTKTSFGNEAIELSIKNWKTDEILKAILPEEDEGLSGFAAVGHIIHINLKAHLEPYKSVIGRILLETSREGVRTVVNKTNTIDNTYRNFSMEVLAGVDDFLVNVKENGESFQFDFSKVYWNPRLSTEHERIVKLLNKNSLLLDVCAGVGPFSVPAGRICKVIANDLNPDSYKWLCVNTSHRKNIACYNKDGRSFIFEEVKDALVDIWEGDGNTIDNIHITINLPAMAVEFLDAFRGLLKSKPHLKSSACPLPLVHVYSFSKSDTPEEDVRTRCEHHLGQQLGHHLQGVSFVRNVAPNKEMMRASFLVPAEVLFSEEGSETCSKRRAEEENGKKEKKQCLD